MSSMDPRYAGRQSCEDIFYAPDIVQAQLT
jgi:hypothetical protein